MTAKILVIDDNCDLADVLAEVLEANGYKVSLANDGEAGLRSLHEGLPDAVILDVEMPHLTGPEVAYRMFVRDAGMEAVPIVLTSGVTHLEDVAAEVGTPYYLGKPFEIAKLLRLLRRALEERTPPTPRRLA